MAQEVTRWPARRTVAVSDRDSFRASRAASAFDSCHTPTMALSIKISRMTAGSMKALMPSSALPSSNNARRNDTTAARSSTCIAKLCQTTCTASVGDGLWYDNR